MKLLVAQLLVIEDVEKTVSRLHAALPVKDSQERVNDTGCSLCVHAHCHEQCQYG